MPFRVRLTTSGSGFLRARSAPSQASASGRMLSSTRASHEFETPLPPPLLDPVTVL